MKKAKKTLLAVYLTIIVVLAALTLVYLNKRQAEGDDKRIFFFFGRDCPHCKIVEQYMADNGIRSKLDIAEYEVQYDKANLQTMSGYAKKCGMDTQMLSVPFIYHSGSCYVGQDDAINFLKNRLSGGGQ